MTQLLLPSKHQDSGYPSYLDVLPRHGTLRNFSNPTYGPRMGMVARLLGQPFMPWQQYAADIAGEVDPATGILVYREVYITLMRQVGKTTFVIVKKAHCALDTPKPVRIMFAAQEGKSAIAKMIAHAELVQTTPLGRMLAPDTPTTSNGKEHVTWRNGSSEWPLSTETSGHGDTIALGAITEAFAHRDDRYIQTMKPAMATNPNAQLLVESTQGNAKSTYWNEQTAELRERYAADPRDLTASRIAFIDYSFGPDDDIGSPEVWRARIPSLGHTMRIEEVQHEWANATTPKKIRAFKRGTGNIVDLGAGEGAVFTEDEWENSGTEDDDIVADRVLTLDVANDRSWSSVAWCGPNRAGLMQSELIAHERSTHWVLPFIGDVLERNPRMPRRVYVVAAGGMAAVMADAFERAGIEMIILSRADYAAACADYYDGITDEGGASIVHRISGQTPLAVAIGGAAWSKGNLPRIWDSLRSTTVISPLVAVSIGPWSYRIDAERRPADDILQTIA